MAGNKDNMFVKAAEKRKVEQQTLESQLTTENVTNTVNDAKVSNRKRSTNLSLSPYHKDKLMNYAKKRHMSASVLVQFWIDEHCI